MKMLPKELLQRSITALLLSSFGIIAFFLFPPWFFSCLILLAMGYILFFEMPKLIPAFWFWPSVIFYPIMPLLMLMYLNQHNNTRMLVFLTFLLVSSNDIGAYFVGKCFGKHKIVPSISPKKTWEGFFGGFIATFLVLFIVMCIYKKELSFLIVLTISFLCSLLATVGDFFESWLKRRAKVKDTGTLLPGHGGLLDRFDSILLVIFFVFFLRNYLINILS